MSPLISFISCILIANQLQSVSPLPGPIPAEVIRVIDGDTIQVRAHIWPGHSVETRVRLAGVDTPEIRRPDCEAERTLGYEAQAFVSARLEPGQAVNLHDVELGSFAGRVIADIALDETKLSALLLEAGLAQPYGASDWCREEG